MKKIVFTVSILLLSSCAGIKVERGQPQPAPQPKQGLQGSWLQGGGVQKVGFWCDVKGGILTFGAFGETEAQATENAKASCAKVYKDKPCELVACKPA